MKRPTTAPCISEIRAAVRVLVRAVGRFVAASGSKTAARALVRAFRGEKTAHYDIGNGEIVPPEKPSRKQAGQSGATTGRGHNGRAHVVKLPFPATTAPIRRAKAESAQPAARAERPLVPIRRARPSGRQSQSAALGPNRRQPFSISSFTKLASPYANARQASHRCFARGRAWCTGISRISPKPAGWFYPSPAA